MCYVHLMRCRLIDPFLFSLIPLVGFFSLPQLSLLLLSYNGLKHLKVVRDDDKYGFSVPCRYNSLLGLILHYSENSLETHNPKLTTTLTYPIYSK